MAVNLNMKINKKNFCLGRSHNYIEPGEHDLQLNRDILAENMLYYKEELSKRLVGMASHHPTAAELDGIIDDIEMLLNDYTDDIERIGRCRVLVELCEDDSGITFKVQ